MFVVELFIFVNSGGFCFGGYFLFLFFYFFSFVVLFVGREMEIICC